MKWPQFLSMGVLFAALSHYLPLAHSVGYFILLALLSYAVPVGMSRFAFQKTVALRWMVAFFLGASPAPRPLCDL